MTIMRRCLMAAGLLLMSATTAALSAPAAAQEVAAWPERGKIVFRGTHGATVVLTNRRGTTSERFEGAVTIEMEVDGAAIKATISGTGGLQRAVMSGLMQDGRCRVRGDKGTVWEGACGPGGFSGTITSGPQEAARYAGRFQTSQTELVDYAERDRRLAAERAAAAAEAKRQADASLALVRIARDSLAKGTANVPELQRICDAGNASVCFELGWAYTHGEGVAKDRAQAIKLYDIACNADILAGCHNLGVMSHSRTAFEKACKGGRTESCDEFGRLCYLDGLWITIDLLNAKIGGSSKYRYVSDFEAGKAEAIALFSETVKYNPSLKDEANEHIEDTRNMKAND